MPFVCALRGKAVVLYQQTTRSQVPSASMASCALLNVGVKCCRGKLEPGPNGHVNKSDSHPVFLFHHEGGLASPLGTDHIAVAGD